jgi:hypothetical protein
MKNWSSKNFSSLDRFYLQAITQCSHGKNKVYKPLGTRWLTSKMLTSFLY